MTAPITLTARRCRFCLTRITPDWQPGKNRDVRTLRNLREECPQCEAATCDECCWIHTPTNFRPPFQRRV